MPQVIVLCQPFYSMCSRCKSNMIENIILFEKGGLNSFFLFSVNRKLLSNRLRYKHNKSKHICVGIILKGRINCIQFPIPCMRKEFPAFDMREYEKCHSLCALNEEEFLFVNILLKFCYLMFDTNNIAY